MRESKIEAYLVAQVRAAGGEVRKVQWIGRRGAPDRLVMLGTDRAVARLADAVGCSDRQAHDLLLELLGLVAVWPELKATGVEAEPHQLREHERMRKMGQIVVVVDSFEGVDKLLGVDGV